MTRVRCIRVLIKLLIQLNSFNVSNLFLFQLAYRNCPALSSFSTLRIRIYLEEFRPMRGEFLLSGYFGDSKIYIAIRSC